MQKEKFKKYLLVGLAAIVLIIPVSAIAFYGGVKMAPYMRGPGFFREEFKKQDDIKRQFEEAHGFMLKKPTPEMQEKFLQRGQEFLGNNADLQRKMLDKLEARILNSPHLNEAEKDQMLKEMQKEREYFGKLKEQAPNFGLQDLKENAPEIKAHWQNMHGNLKSLSGKMLQGRMEDAFTKGQRLKENLTKKIAELENAGLDVTQLKILQADLKEKMDLAKEQFDLAKKKYQAASDVEDVPEIMQEVHAYVQQGNEYLMESKDLFKEIMEEMKGLNR